MTPCASHRYFLPPEDLLWFHLTFGEIEDVDGKVTLLAEDGPMTVPLKGLYRLQRVENGIPEAGTSRLLTKEQFESGYGEFDEPYFEYRVKFLPRCNDVVTHGSLERAKAALVEAPILRNSGEYGIVRRLIHEPGDWEHMPDETFDQASAA